jgi:hypothetical protein
VVDGQLASDVEVASDSQLSFVAPIGIPLARPALALSDRRGVAVAERAFRYTPGARPGLLLFSAFGSDFATFFDPVDGSLVTIPRVTPQQVRFTTVARDEVDYWAMDRNGRYGRLDLSSQQVESPLQTGSVFPTMIHDRGALYAIDRNTLRFGTFDPSTGFQAIGTTQLPCCGHGLAASPDGTFYVTSGGGVSANLATIDRTTGVMSPPTTITGVGAGFHVEEMRFFAGKLYAASRDGTLVMIDPDTAIATLLVSFAGFEQFKAMEVFD